MKGHLKEKKENLIQVTDILETLALTCPNEGVSKKKNRGVKGRCQTGHIEKVSRRISYRLLEDHDPPECLFTRSF